jgi:hypothetical protein
MPHFHALFSNKPKTLDDVVHVRVRTESLRRVLSHEYRYLSEGLRNEFLLSLSHAHECGEDTVIGCAYGVLKFVTCDMIEELHLLLSSEKHRQEEVF